MSPASGSGSGEVGLVDIVDPTPQYGAAAFPLFALGTALRNTAKFGYAQYAHDARVLGFRRVHSTLLGPTCTGVVRFGTHTLSTVLTADCSYLRFKRVQCATFCLEVFPSVPFRSPLRVRRGTHRAAPIPDKCRYGFEGWYGTIGATEERKPHGGTFKSQITSICGQEGTWRDRQRQGKF